MNALSYGRCRFERAFFAHVDEAGPPKADDDARQPLDLTNCRIDGRRCPGPIVPAWIA